jgi:hypothetical protein
VEHATSRDLSFYKQSEFNRILYVAIIMVRKQIAILAESVGSKKNEV